MIVCQVINIMPCVLCNIPLLGVAICPQPIPVGCFICNELGAVGLTDYMMNNNSTILPEGFMMPNGTVL